MADLVTSGGGGKNTITIAGLTLPIAGLRSLHSRSFGASAYSSPRLPNASAGYSPGVGKKFVVKALRAAIVTPAASTLGGGVGYANVDSGADGTSSIPAGLFMLGNGTNTAIDFTTAGIKEFAIPDGFEVPAGKYITISSGNSTVVIGWEVFGYEVNA